MLQVNKVLQYYQRKDIQIALVAGCKDKEVAIKYGEGGFGKRPDILQYGSDVWQLAKQGATSFHISEESWKNPLQLHVGMNRQDIDTLRKGWDLVLDIDSPNWSLSKLTAWLLITALREHSVNSISIKFSGNKGFHIGVPFEAFPQQVAGKDLALLFPEAPRKIAAYLIDYICRCHIQVSNNKIVFGKKYSIPVDRLLEKTSFQEKDLLKKVCRQCNAPFKEALLSKTEFICSGCETRLLVDQDQPYCQCPNCLKLMEKVSAAESRCSCGSIEYDLLFNHQALLEVDTILISSRHLYRAVFSLHEKSGLVSVPFDPDKVLSFSKKDADPTTVQLSVPFLDRSFANPGEAAQLLQAAFDYAAAREVHHQGQQFSFLSTFSNEEFEQFDEPLPIELSPPCMHNILRGMKDGKKRAMFLLVNFLSSVGWKHDQIQQLLHEWNDKNEEALRETVIQGKLRHQQQLKKPMLPPNCDNEMYYKGIGVCTPDNLCMKIKNPVQYARRKVLMSRRKDGDDKQVKRKNKSASTTDEIKHPLPQE